MSRSSPYYGESCLRTGSANGNIETAAVIKRVRGDRDWRPFKCDLAHFIQASAVEAKGGRHIVLAANVSIQTTQATPHQCPELKLTIGSENCVWAGGRLACEPSAMRIERGSLWEWLPSAKAGPKRLLAFVTAGLEVA